MNRTTTVLNNLLRMRFLASFFIIIVFAVNGRPTCPKTTGRAEILPNANFEAGAAGFTPGAGYTQGTCTPTLGGNSYAVCTNPNNLNTSYFKSMGDHTTGSGNMYIVDFANTPNPNPLLTYPAINVTSGNLYVFSAWFANIAIGNNGTCATCPGGTKINFSPILKFEITNDAGGGILLSEQVHVDSLTNNWNQYVNDFISPITGKISIKIYNMRQGNGSNDLALDDVSFKNSCEGIRDLNSIGRGISLIDTVYTCNVDFDYLLDTHLPNNRFAFNWYQNNALVTDGILTDDATKAASSNSFNITAAPTNGTKYYVCYDTIGDGVTCPRLDSVLFINQFKYDIPDRKICPPVNEILDPSLTTTNITSWTYERVSPSPTVLATGSGAVPTQAVSKAGTYRLTVVHGLGNTACPSTADLIKVDTIAAAFTGAINASCTGGVATGTATLIPSTTGAQSVTKIGGVVKVSWYKNATGGSAVSTGTGATGVSTTPASDLVTSNPACPQGGLYLQDDFSYPTTVPLANCGGAVPAEINGNETSIFQKITLTAPAAVSSLNVYTKSNNTGGEDVTVKIDLFPGTLANFNSPGTPTATIATRELTGFTSNALTSVSVPGTGYVIQPGTYYIRVMSTKTGTTEARAIGYQNGCRGVAASNYQDNTSPSTITFDPDFREYNNLKTNVHGVFFNAKFQVGNPASCGRVWVCAVCSAPVQYTHFEVYPTGGNDVLLTWGTAHESDNKKFVIEASADGINFEAVGEVAGHNNSQLAREYSFVHSATATRQYYRIKQVDYKGSFSYTNIKSVHLQGDNFVGTVYPQPVKGGDILNIELNGLTTASLDLKLANASGHVVLSQSVSLEEEGHLLRVNTAGLHAGIYLLTLSNADYVKTVRVVVQ